MPENFDNIPEHAYKKDEYIIGPFGRKRDNFPRNYLSPLSDFLFNLYDKPATWLHDKVVVPNRKQSVYYHWKFPRVPTVDECYVDDYACLFEADMQYKRDRMVEQNILQILDRRVLDCEQSFGGLGSSGSVEWCREVKKDLEDAQTNYMIKYGELPADGSSRLNLMEAKTRSADVYLKQKHRFIWERRQQMKAKQEQLDQAQESN